MWSFTFAKRMSSNRTHKIPNSYVSWHTMSHCLIPILYDLQHIVR